MIFVNKITEITNFTVLTYGNICQGSVIYNSHHRQQHTATVVENSLSQTPRTEKIATSNW